MPSQILTDVPSDIQDWWPSEHEYTPGLDVQQWSELLKNSDIFTPNALVLMQRMLEIGGTATCKQLSDIYGEHYGFYIGSSVNLAKRIWQHVNCPILKRDNNANKWWPILYVGKSVDKNTPGTYAWRLRPELHAALQQFDFPPPKTSPATSPTPYTIQTIRNEGCFLPLDILERMFDRLQAKKNIILQGPPGTGKTWLAKRLAWALVGERESLRVQALQFHATLSYEDFVCGWRPVGEGKLELVDGPFLKAIAKAKEVPNTPYVLVIEEINRGNPAQIFGEMLTLLEDDKRKPEEALRLCYKSSNDEPVHLPTNLYLVGTMNIADRSLAIVDFALRRRFAFYTLTPHFGDEWQKWMRDRAGLPENFITALADAMQACNAIIADDDSLGPQYAIGHSFVTCDKPIDDPKAWMEEIVAAEITPLLKEYWFNNLGKALETAQNILKTLP